MELRDIRRVYLVGIGGIGMSGLARYFQHLGCVVCGYDKTSTELTTQLHNEGIQIIFEDKTDDPSSIKKVKLELRGQAGLAQTKVIALILAGLVLCIVSNYIIIWLFG